MPWKKIASLFAVSLSFGILSASCAAGIEEQSAAPDDAEPAEACEALQAADGAGTPLPELAHDRARLDVEQCQRRCEAFYFQCVIRAERARDHGQGRRERCEQVRDDCRSNCERRRLLL